MPLFLHTAACLCFFWLTNIYLLSLIETFYQYNTFWCRLPKSRIQKVCPAQDPLFTFLFYKINNQSAIWETSSALDEFITFKEGFSFLQLVGNKFKIFVKILLICNWFARDYMNISFFLKCRHLNLLNIFPQFFG